MIVVGRKGGGVRLTVSFPTPRHAGRVLMIRPVEVGEAGGEGEGRGSGGVLVGCHLRDEIACATQERNERRVSGLERCGCEEVKIRDRALTLRIRTSPPCWAVRSSRGSSSDVSSAGPMKLVHTICSIPLGRITKGVPPPWRQALLTARSSAEGTETGGRRTTSTLSPRLLCLDVSHSSLLHLLKHLKPLTQHI